MEYCSHEFVAFSFDGLLRRTLGAVVSYLSDQTKSLHDDVKPFLRLPEKAKLGEQDYPFRPDALEEFPLYFFLAGCEASTNLNSNSMMWKTLPCGDGTHVLYQRSRYPEPMLSKRCDGRYLIDADNKPIYKYGYYVRLRTDVAWKVPVPHGRCPPVPDESAPAQEKAQATLKAARERMDSSMDKRAKKRRHSASEVVAAGTPTIRRFQIPRTHREWRYCS